MKHDCNHCLKHETLLLETALVRIYLDGSTTPVIEENLRYLLGGGTETEQEHQYHERRVPPYAPDEKTFLGGFGTLPFPFAGIQSLGCNLYLPIPYAKHCKVTYDRPGNCFCRINYRTYSPETIVETFTLADLKHAAPLIERVGQVLLNPGQAESLSKLYPEQTASLESGATLAVDLDNGLVDMYVDYVRVYGGAAANKTGRTQ